MGDLFKTFLSSIKYQFSSIWLRFRTLTSKAYLKNQLWGKIKLFFTKLFDIKPKHKNDYYGILFWLVSKRLAYLIVIVIGIVSVSFLYDNKTNFFHTDSEGEKSYSYSSVLLRFAKGNVRIKGKGGYLAYEGNVEKGQVIGKGKLYDHEERLLYEGEFANNYFSGHGLLYYPNSNVRYDGYFAENLFEGNGTEYRENGSLLYHGEYKKGLKDGEGTLYDTGSEAIFTGSFQADDIMYSTFLGKTTEEVTSIYTGTRVLYEGNNYFNVYMQDIDAIYEGESNDDALDDAIKVKSIYVLNDTINVSNARISKKSELQLFFGEPIYEGESLITQSEAIAISEIRRETGDSVFNNPGLMTKTIYDDDYEITSYQDMTVYVQSYLFGDLEYTFVSGEASSDEFGFYYISK